MLTTPIDVDVAGHGLAEGAKVDDVSVSPVSADDVESHSRSVTEDGQRLSSTNEIDSQPSCECCCR